MVLLGRLGLESARIPHVDRHGLVWLERGRLYVEDGTLRFEAAASTSLEPGDYAIPFQMLSAILIGPGSSVTHDVLRLLARHGTALVAIGEGGTRIYTAPPMGADESRLARRQARLWADPDTRIGIARRMFAWRFDEVLPHEDPAVLRGMEGARLKRAYQLIAERHGVPWRGRRYDRANPDATDLPNQAINHAVTCIEAAAAIAVAATRTIPQLGFIHEDSGQAFILDITDLVRTTATLPLAFATARRCLDDPKLILERELRRKASELFRKERLVDQLIERIKALFEADS